MNAKTELAALIGACALAIAPTNGHARALAVLALQGDESPAMGSPAFKKFEDPAISDAAGQHVTFAARTHDRQTCVFKMNPAGADAVVACKGDLAPDGHAFRSFSTPTIDNAAEVAWSSLVTGDRAGVFRGDPLIVDLTGDPVPGGGLVDTFKPALLTASGAVVFVASISGGGAGVDQGILRCTGGDANCSSGTGALEALVRGNDPVPDRPGREFCSFLALAASDWGIAFRAGTKVDCTNGWPSGRAPTASSCRTSSSCATPRPVPRPPPRRRSPKATSTAVATCSRSSAIRR